MSCQNHNHSHAQDEHRCCGKCKNKKTDPDVAYPGHDSFIGYSVLTTVLVLFTLANFLATGLFSIELAWMFSKIAVWFDMTLPIGRVELVGWITAISLFSEVLTFRSHLTLIQRTKSLVEPDAPFLIRSSQVTLQSIVIKVCLMAFGIPLMLLCAKIVAFLANWIC